MPHGEPLMSLSAAGHSETSSSTDLHHTPQNEPGAQFHLSNGSHPGNGPSEHSAEIEPRLLPSNWLIWTMRLLCTVALSVSGYLAWTAFQASEVYGCGGGEVFDCGHVLTSSWSKWFGIPVSVPAFGLYASLIAVLAFFRQSAPEKLLRHGWQALTIGAFSAGMAALWFIGIQVFALGHLCIYCIAAHTCGLVLAGLIAYHQPLGWNSVARLVPVAALGLVVLISGQFLSPEQQTFVIERVDSETPASPSGSGVAAASETFDAPGDETDTEIFDAPMEDEPTVDVAPEPTEGEHKSTVERNETSESSNGVASSLLLITPPRYWRFAGLILQEAEATASQESQESTAAKADEKPAEEKPAEPKKPEPRMINVSGKFQLDAYRWPLLGNPEAKYVFVEMFDYTCPHCRNTHRAVHEALQKFGDDLAIIALPVSVHGACSESATATSVPHGDSCELARLSIAVWRIDRTKFQQYHDWMFSGGRNRTISEAKKQAESLVGADALRKELDKKVAGQYLKKHGELYNKAGAGSVPKLLFTRSTLVGEVGNGRTLTGIIEREALIEKPTPAE